MDLPQLSQVGIGGILCLLILKEVFSFLKTKNHFKQEDLPEGEVPVWYVGKSLERSIDRLSANIDKLNEALQEMHSDINETKTGMKTIHEMVRDISRERNRIY